MNNLKIYYYSVLKLPKISRYQLLHKCTMARCQFQPTEIELIKSEDGYLHIYSA